MLLSEDKHWMMCLGGGNRDWTSPYVKGCGSPYQPREGETEELLQKYAENLQLPEDSKQDAGFTDREA